MLTSFTSHSSPKSSSATSDSRLISTPSLDQLISNFLQQITQLPNFEVLSSPTEQTILHKQLKSTILLEVQEAPKKIEEIHNDFISGKFDHLVFGESPQLTEELKIIISKYNREFIQRLFTKCPTNENLQFWLSNPDVKLPKDTWALAVNLGNNIFVLKHLKENGWFDNISSKDKDDLLKRAQRFKGEGLEYLKKEFSENSAKLKM